VQRLLARLFEAIGLDELFERTGGSGNLYHLSYIGGPSRLLGLIVFWGILLSGGRGLPERPRLRLSGADD
jgi:hypothetical protein